VVSCGLHALLLGSAASVIAGVRDQALPVAIGLQAEMVLPAELYSPLPIDAALLKALPEEPQSPRRSDAPLSDSPDALLADLERIAAMERTRGFQKAEAQLETMAGPMTPATSPASTATGYLSRPSSPVSVPSVPDPAPTSVPPPVVEPKNPDPVPAVITPPPADPAPAFTPARLVTFTVPRALQGRWQGTVEARITVAADGTPSAASLDKGTGDDAYDRALVAALLKATYKAGQRDGMHVETVLLQSITVR